MSYNPPGNRSGSTRRQLTARRERAIPGRVDIDDRAAGVVRDLFEDVASGRCSRRRDHEPPSCVEPLFGTPMYSASRSCDFVACERVRASDGSWVGHDKVVRAGCRRRPPRSPALANTKGPSRARDARPMRSLLSPLSAVLNGWSASYVCTRSEPSGSRRATSPASAGRKSRRSHPGEELQGIDHRQVAADPGVHDERQDFVTGVG